MTKKRQLIAITIILALIPIIIYSCSSIYLVEPFFLVPFSHPEAPIDELFSWSGSIYYNIKCIFIRAHIALDSKGYIYILGHKEGKARILVLNQQGKIEQIVTPRLKDGRFLWGSLLSVSPSGNYIWIVEREGKLGIYRIIVHDRNGRAKMDWLISGDIIEHLAFNACSEHSAYLVSNVVEFFIFKIGQKLQKIKLSDNFHPPYPIFFHDGRYWGIIGLKWLIPQINRKEFKKQIKKLIIKENLFGVVTWLPHEGTRLVSIIELPGLKQETATVVLQWIDKKGNFYITRGGYTSLYESLPPWAKKGILGGKIVKILKALSLYDRFRKLKHSVIVEIFSPKGELLDVIPVSRIIRPARGEKLEYGQLVKVDEKGIYWEVEKVNEPREYRIVRIVKKKRWQVWWDALRSWLNLAQSEGKER